MTWPGPVPTLERSRYVAVCPHPPFPSFPRAAPSLNLHVVTSHSGPPDHIPLLPAGAALPVAQVVVRVCQEYPRMLHLLLTTHERRGVRYRQQLSLDNCNHGQLDGVEAAELGVSRSRACRGGHGCAEPGLFVVDLEADGLGSGRLGSQELDMVPTALETLSCPTSTSDCAPD